MADNEQLDRIEAFLGQIVQRLDSMDQRMDRMEQRLDSMDQRMDRMEQRLDKMEQRLDRMEQRMDRMEQRMDKMEQRLDGFDLRFQQIDQRFDRVDTSIESLIERSDRIEQFVMALRRETSSRFEALENKLDLIRSTAASFDTARNLIDKTLMDVTSNNIKLAAQQWEHKDLTLELANRIAKLEAEFAKLSKPAA